MASNQVDRRSRSRRSRGPLVAVGVVTALVAAGGLALAVRDGGEPGCPEAGTALQVTAAPDIAPVVSSVARQLSTPDGGCVTVQVSAQEPADVVHALAAGSIRPPDVWVPDSSLWLTRAATDRVARPEDAKPIATSPLVLAVPAPAAARLGASVERPEVDDVVAATNAGTGVVLQLSGERLSPARVGAILALRTATGARSDARGALAGLLQSARVDDSPMADQLDGLAGAENVAVPAPEQAVWAHNRGGGGAGDASDGTVPVVAVYPGGASFDYPYAVLSTDPATVTSAGRLLDLLRGEQGQAAVRAAGFRDLSGTADPSLADDTGVDATRPGSAGPLDEGSLDEAERTLDAVKLDARLLAVLDVSGSMGLPAPTGGPGATRLSLAVEAASRGLSLYPDSTDVGLWVFSKDLPGGTDYREVVPIAPLSADPASRERLAATLAGIAPVEGGDTALYDTTLAAVRAVQAGWVPGRVNAVVLLSDGRNTDEQGVTLEQLLAALQAERRADQPVPVITIAYGPDSDAASLAQIAAVTGGAAYTSADPAQIRQVFLDAIGQRACRPNCPASPLA